MDLGLFVQKKDIVFRVRVLAIATAREFTAPLLSYSLVLACVARCHKNVYDGFYFEFKSDSGSELRGIRTIFNTGCVI